MVLVICLWLLCVCRFLPCLQYGRERYWLHFKEVRESMITETFMGSCTCVRVYLPQSFSPTQLLLHSLQHKNKNVQSLWNCCTGE